MNDNQNAKHEGLRTPIEAATRRALTDIEKSTAADSTWQARAACQDVPPATAAAMQNASTLEHGEVLGWRCEACPVAWECLEQGLALGGSGLHGGFVLIDGEEVAA